MDLANYIIVSPCKNEEKNLLSLAESIINQTTKPKMWFIFDDGSTDNTSAILDDLKHMYEWIIIFNGSDAKRDLGFHYAEIVDTSIKNALEICNERKITIGYIGLIDADMILESTFFEKIIERFTVNPKLGVASGNVVYKTGSKIIYEKGRDNLPIGGLRVWRRKCFDDTGGFPKSYSADAVSNVSAVLAGWDTKKFKDIIGIQTRQTSSAEGLWKGYKTKGESDYFRDYHPVYVLCKFIKYILTYPFYIGIAYSSSYISSVLSKKDKIKNLQVRKYYRNKYKEIINFYSSKIRI